MNTLTPYSLSTLEELKRELDGTRALIQNTALQSLPSQHHQDWELLGLGESPSLLEQCQQLLSATVDPDLNTIRTVHHFACTGGTLISKAIAALPSTYLLSELHPHSPIRKTEKTFAPSDLALLAHAAQMPNASELAERIMAASILEAHKWATAFGGQLVLRDHTHSDFCVGEEPSPGSVINRLCDQTFDQRLSLVTVRHPFDSWLSLTKNGWVHFQPGDFDEYCKRYHAFLDDLEGHPIVRYEDFTASPAETLDAICEALQLPTSDTAEFTFALFRLSGDSGRTATRIGGRTRQGADQNVPFSTAYQPLLARLGYEE